jgi:hypothetical protein
LLNILIITSCLQSSGTTAAARYAAVYSAACLNQDLEDTVALSILNTCSEVLPTDPLKPLNPALRSHETTIAVMALERPAWLQVLLKKGLKPGAR